MAIIEYAEEHGLKGSDLEKAYKKVFGRYYPQVRWNHITRRKIDYIASHYPFPIYLLHLFPLSHYGSCNTHHRL